MILCLGTTPAVQHVMVFRSLALDRVNRALTTMDCAAGKSINVAKVLKALGEQPVALGFLGGDRGEFILAVLKGKGIERDFIQVAARTRECVTVIDESAGTHTELVEESCSVKSGDYRKLLAAVRRRLRGCRAMVLSGSITPNGPANLYFECARLAREAGAFALVDAQGAALLEALKAKPALVKPNRAELGATLGRELKGEKAVRAAMRELCQRGAERVVVTAGKDEALAFDGNSFWRIVPPKVRIANPIGSGDAFTAGILWRLLRGDDLGEACRWGAASGTANALTLLPGELSLGEVQRLVKSVKVERVGDHRAADKV